MGQVKQKTHFFIVGKYIHSIQFTHMITISESDKQTYAPKVRQWEVRSTIHQILFGKRNQRTPTVIRLLDISTVKSKYSASHHVTRIFLGTT